MRTSPLVWSILLSSCLACSGSARQEPTTAESSYTPCAGKACGEPCSLCRPGDASCQEEVGAKACDSAGSCRLVPFECEAPNAVPAQPTPDAYAACAGKGCGQPCTACPPGAPECMETAVPKACTERGECAPAPVDCSGVSDGGVPAHQ